MAQWEQRYFMQLAKQWPAAAKATQKKTASFSEQVVYWWSLIYSALCLVMSKWAMGDHFPTYIRSKWATRWGLNTNQIFFTSKWSVFQGFIFSEWFEFDGLISSPPLKRNDSYECPVEEGPFKPVNPGCWIIRWIYPSAQLKPGLAHAWSVFLEMTFGASIPQSRFLMG